MNHETWIIDVVCSKAIKSADTFIFLDLPRYLCFWRAIKRSIRYLFKSRPEMPPKCPDIMILPYVAKLIWNFPNKVRPHLLETINQARNHKEIIHIRSTKQWKRFITQFHKKQLGQNKLPAIGTA